jgi:hypothetical protein
MFRTVSFAALLLSLTAGLPWAGAADEDPLRPISPVSQVKIPNFRDYGMEGNHVLSPDGKTLAGAMHNTVILYNLSAPPYADDRRSLGGYNRFFMVSAIAFSADGKLLAGVGAQHGEDQTVHFFDVQTGKEVRQLDNDQPFFGVALSPDGKVIALGTNQYIELWDAVTGDELRILQGEANTVYRALAFSPDGKMLASAGNDSTIQVWEIASGQERCRFHVQVEATEDRRFYRGGQFPIAALAFSGDGKLLAAGCSDNSIRLWNMRTGQEQPPLSGHLAGVCALAFTKDGKRMVSFDHDGLRLAWSVRGLERPPIDRLPALSEAEFDEAWTDLADGDAFHFYRAMRYLTADPGRTLALMNRQLHPVPVGDSQRLAQLVTDLQSPKASVRRKAMSALRKEGEAALGALAQGTEQAQGNPNLAMNVRVARFRGGMPGDGGFGSLVRKLEEQSATPERARSLRAVKVLEQIDNDQARELLEKLSKGAAGAKLTVAARAALERLKTRKEGEKGSARAGAETNALGPRELDGLWTGLASSDAAAAFKAMRALGTDPRQSVAYLQEHLRPSLGADVTQIPKSIAALDNDRFAEREKAMKALSSFGKLAEPALRQALTQSLSAEARRRVEQLVDKCERATLSPDTLRSLRAIEVLEQLNTPEAREVLQKLTKGTPSAEATREAVAALERMAQRLDGALRMAPK